MTTPIVVIAKKVGRLANRLLLYSHFIGASREHGFTVVNASFHPFHRFFPTTATDLLCRYPRGLPVPVLPGSHRLLYHSVLWRAERLHRRQLRGADVGLIRLRRDQHLDLNSHTFLDVLDRHRVVLVQDWFFRNGENCVRHGDAIRAHLTPNRPILEAADRVVEPLRARGRLVVGVHIRQGDYRRFKDGAHFFTHAQYRRAMERTAAAFADKDAAFVICSDEPVPEGSFTGLETVAGPGGAPDDLYTLAACDLLLGPLSTYNTWASFYGRVPLHRLTDPDAELTPRDFGVQEGLGAVPPPAAGHRDLAGI